MKWVMNQELLQNKINKINNKIDVDNILKRLSVYLNVTENEIYENISKEDIKNLISTIIVNRDLDNDVDNVINSIHTSILDPKKLINAIEASDLIYSYLMNPNATIMIYADYDVDGVTSGYVLYSALMEIAKCNIILKYPNRKDGYGINIDFCKQVIDLNIENTLVITVDNGITKVKEINYLKENNIEVIVLDHHESKEIVPNCLIVNPHNKTIIQDNTYKHLCGCGIAFKVAQLVQEKHGIYNMMNYTPYLALATLADVMPLTNENIAFIQYGLDIINSEKCPIGIKEMKNRFGLDIVTAEDILWSFAPSLNACGRLGDTELASKLFFTDNTPIEDVVSKILDVNEERKKHTKKMTEQLKKMNFDNDKVCIVQFKDCPPGILGILAGRAVEIFNKPSIVVGNDSNGIVSGSSRSCRGVNLQKEFGLQQQLDNIIDFGGHEEAAGISFYIDKIDSLRQSLNERVEYVDTIIEEQIEEVEQELIIDEVISYNNINKILYALINIIPFDNKKLSIPTFAITDLEVLSYELSKNNPSNIKFTFKNNNKKIILWAWGLADKYKELGCPKYVHIAGNIKALNKNSYSYFNYSFNIVDIMSA